jgi:hypothetical protein
MDKESTDYTTDATNGNNIEEEKEELGTHFVMPGMFIKSNS